MTLLTLIADCMAREKELLDWHRTGSLFYDFSIRPRRHSSFTPHRELMATLNQPPYFAIGTVPAHITLTAAIIRCLPTDESVQLQGLLTNPSPLVQLCDITCDLAYYDAAGVFVGLDLTERQPKVVLDPGKSMPFIIRRLDVPATADRCVLNVHARCWAIVDSHNEDVPTQEYLRHDLA